MDFFDQQESARRASRWLIAWYLLAVAFVVLCFNLAVALAYALLAIYGALPLAGGEPLVWNGLWSTYWHAVANVPPKVHYVVSGLVTVTSISGQDTSDHLQVNTLDGHDTVRIDREVPAAIDVDVDLGAGQL